MEIVFCTNNQHKLTEIGQILGSQIAFLTLKDIGFNDEIPEPFDTLEENSFTKANQVYQKTGRNCVAEDTGLFIEALNGEPGVFSARYAGPECDSNKNMDKVLDQLEEVKSRSAYFKTVISLIIDGKLTQFEGRCDGYIAMNKLGDDGFGYDPIFIPNGYHQSFAELSSNQKNEISHRRKALDAFINYLNQRSTQST